MLEKRVRDYLIERIRKEHDPRITYQLLSDNCNLKLNMRNKLNRYKIGTLLGNIARNEFKNKRPLLTALVIKSRDQLEGDGFFKLAEELGLGKWKSLKRNCFEVEQIVASIDFWKNDENYALFK